MKEALYIGDLAKQAGVTIDTIRYYEKLGLLPKPVRTSSGYRVYQNDVLLRLTFIKQAQALDLSLTEITEILNYQNNDRAACQNVQSLLKEKLNEINSRINKLKAFRKTLSNYLEQCNNALYQNQADCCPVIEEIAHKPSSSQKVTVKEKQIKKIRYEKE